MLLPKIVSSLCILIPVLLIRSVLCSVELFKNNKKDLLIRLIKDSNFPDWVDKTISTKITRPVESFDSLDDFYLYSRRVLYVLRTTWFLEKEPVKKEYGDIEYKLYPYEISAILGLIPWNDCIKYNKNVSSDASTEELEMIYREMSIHAFDLLSKTKDVVDFDYITLCMALLPLRQKTYLRLGLLEFPITGIIQPTQTYPNIRLNKFFNVMLINIDYDYLSKPFDESMTKIEFKDVSLNDLASCKISENQDNLFCAMRNFKALTKSGLSKEEATMRIQRMRRFYIDSALEAVETDNLRLNLFPLAFSFTKYYKAKIPPISVEDVLKVRFDFEFDPSSLVIEEDSLESFSKFLQTEILKIGIEKLKKSLLERFFQDEQHSIDGNLIIKDAQDIKFAIERVKLINDTIKSCIRAKDENFTLTWAVAAILGLADWKDVIEEWQVSFLKSDNGQFRANARAYINWFGDRIIGNSENSLAFAGLDGSSTLSQVQNAIFHSFLLWNKHRSETVLLSLKILISIRTIQILDRNTALMMMLLNLVPKNEPVWMFRITQRHATTMKIVPSADTENQETVCEVRIFNTGEDRALLHQTINGHYRFAEYKNVPLALLLIDSVGFHIHLDDAAAMFKASNTENFTWLLYPDEIYRNEKDLMNSSNMSDDSTEEDPKDLYKSQITGTCSARSLMALLKSELGRKDFKWWKMMIGISILDKYS